MVRIFGKIQFAFIAALLFSLNTFAGGAIAGKVTIVKAKSLLFVVVKKSKLKKTPRF